MTDNPSDAEIKDLVMRIPLAVTLAREIEKLIVKWSAEANPSDCCFTISDDRFVWPYLCAVLTSCRTQLKDEWLLCGPLMLTHVRFDPAFVQLPEPIQCGESFAMLYIGNLKSVSVYIRPSLENENEGWFFIGAGSRMSFGRLHSDFNHLSRQQPLEPVLNRGAAARDVMDEAVDIVNNPNLILDELDVNWHADPVDPLF